MTRIRGRLRISDIFVRGYVPMHIAQPPKQWQSIIMPLRIQLLNINKSHENTKANPELKLRPSLLSPVLEIHLKIEGHKCIVVYLWRLWYFLKQLVISLAYNDIEQRKSSLAFSKVNKSAYHHVSSCTKDFEILEMADIEGGLTALQY